MADHTKTTQKQIRESFWREHHQLTRRPGATQNDYPADTRMAFVDYVERLRRDGDISEALAQRATL